MITSSKQVDSPTKKEEDSNDGKISKASSSSAPWLRLKDPRIVRVSRAFGGKDRHSKVCTIRGLRDRRVRLSVPTAIQLYDLQDRLGLNQPSKVVDWLLNAAKHEIDELPPLPMPPGNFSLNHQAMLGSSNEVGASRSSKEVFKMNNGVDWEDTSGFTRPSFWNADAILRAKSKEVMTDPVNEKENWAKRDEEDKEDGSTIEGNTAQALSSSFLQRASHSSLPGLINNAMPYGSFFHLEPQSFPLSHMGNHGFATQTGDIHNLNVVPLSSALSLSSGSQILVCPPGTTQSYFPSHATASMEIDPRQINHFQWLTPSTQNLLPNSLTPSPYPISQSMRPSQYFSVTPRVLHSQNSESPPDKDPQFPCK
jgi:hypothetical protein